MLPEFDINPIRPDKEPHIDETVFFPDWQCFCCHDSGFVDPRLTKLVIREYDYWRDKRAVCQRCEEGIHYEDYYDNYDQRFSKQVCNELDTIERREWADEAKAQQRRINLNQLNKSMTMPGAIGRTANDEREIQLRKQEIEVRDSIVVSN